MKAGIYKRRDNGKHIYVSKDRSIRAHQVTDCHPINARLRMVNCQQKEQVVRFIDIYDNPADVCDNPDMLRIADRVADIPNGTTNHAEYLQHYVDSLPKSEAKGGVVDAERIAKAMQTAPEVRVHASDVQRTLDAYSQVYDKDNAGERFQGRPRSLGIGFGAKSFLASAKVIQEAGVGVPPHVASKIVEEYRASHPVDADFSQLETRVAAMPMDRLMQIMRQDMNAAQWMQQNLAFGYLAEALGFAEVIQDSVYIHDLDKLEELKEHVKAGRYVLAKTAIGYELVDSLPGKSKHVPLSFEAVAAIHLAAFPKFRFIDNSKILALAVPVKGPDMPKAMKRHGAKGVVAYTDWEKAVLHKLQAGEIRLCGKQSKRKHRKAGHYVFWFAPLQSWAWEKRA